MVDYLAKRATATRLIEKYGLAATLSQRGTPVGPAWDSGPGVPVTTTIKLVDVSSDRNDEGSSMKVRVMSKVIIAVPTSAVPEKGDRILFAGLTRIVDDISPVAPGGVAVLYEAKLIG